MPLFNVGDRVERIGPRSDMDEGGHHYEAHSKQGWHRVGGLSGEWLHRSVVAKNLLLVIDDNRKFDAHSWYHIPEFPYVSFIFGGVWTPITTRP
jgi:hypothetical protein